MSQIPPHADETTKAPPAFRDALAELVQFGLTVARMVARTAEAETALADAAAKAGAADGVSAIATSLAEAIEADRATAAAAEARHSVVARTEVVAAAFARVSRSIRLTVMLAERLDRGWARPGASDDRDTMTRRQSAREHATGREAEGERAGRPEGALAERLEALETEAGIGNRAAEEILGLIYRYLGLDPVRMTVKSPVPGIISPAEADGGASFTGHAKNREARAPQRRPDG